MKTSALVHISSAHQGSSSVLKFSRVKEWVCNVSNVEFFKAGSLYVLSAVITSVSIGMSATFVKAQTYYDRPISTTNGAGYVETSTGIGLNIRSEPGLGSPIIGGAEDGVYLNLIGTPVDADGYRWRELTTGGWVATEYLVGTNTGNVGYDPCYRPISACGGTSQPVQAAFPRPAAFQPSTTTSTGRPSVTTATAGRYVVAVPGSDAQTITQVRRFVPRAYVDRAREGTFVNAGGYADYDGARALSHTLRANGLDARVIYR